jgi:site-specific DNA-methyltransferase (adenine-specific)
MSIQLYQGDCQVVLSNLADNSIDSVVSDPPYGLSDHSPEDIKNCLSAWIANKEYKHNKNGFMNRAWDAFVPGPEIWKECLRVLKPGGHMLCFAGTRSMDLMSMAIRLSGFELRDSIGNAHETGQAPLCAWVHGQGMPHGIDVGKKLPDYKGFATSLKPAWEPILIARKPLEGNAVQNVEKYGTGALNIDACRLPIDPEIDDPRLGGKGTWGTEKAAKNVYAGGYEGIRVTSSEAGRFPSNVIIDDSKEVQEVFDQAGEKKSGKPGTRRKEHKTHSMAGTLNLTGEQETGYADKGSAARFFYQAKATNKDRDGSKHVSVKPITLMRYLVKMVTPKNGTVLDPFAGSGTTGQAANEEGFNAILIEREQEYADDIRHRLFMFIDKDEVM